MKKQIMCVIVSVVLLAGCATDRERTQGEGAGVGAFGGAALGALLGYAAGGTKGAIVGAAAGAGVGAAAGYGYGTHVANQKEKFASVEDYLDANIQDAHQKNEQFQQYNASLAREIKGLEQATALLVEQYNQGARTKGAMQHQEQLLATKIAKEQKQLQRMSYELEQQRGVLAREQGQSPERLKKLQIEFTGLERNKVVLVQGVNILASMQTRVAV
jgi:hypothetical protein